MLSDQYEEKVTYEKPKGEIDSLIQFFTHNKDSQKLVPEQLYTIVLKNFSVVGICEFQ